jgi:hypothetical protein
MILHSIASSKRVTLSFALSIVAHALLLASFGGVWQPKGKTVANHMLTVRLLALPVTPIIPEIEPPEKSVLSRTTSDYHIPDTPKPIQTVEVAPPAKNRSTEIRVREQVADTAPQGTPAGLGFPKMIGLPWAPNLQVRPVQRHEQPVEAYREMHDQETTAQRQLAMLAQMSAALGARLAGNMQQANGRCTVSQSAEIQSLQFNCEPAALEELLRAKHIVLLNSLFTGIAGKAAAFDIVIFQNKARIIAMSDNIHRSK